MIDIIIDWTAEKNSNYILSIGITNAVKKYNDKAKQTNFIRWIPLAFVSIR